MNCYCLENECGTVGGGDYCCNYTNCCCNTVGAGSFYVAPVVKSDVKPRLPPRAIPPPPKHTVSLRLYDLSSQTFDVLKHGVMKLIPAALADLDPPVQILWAFNGGDIPISFSVDMEPFNKLKKDNFDHAAIDCLTHNGIVLPKSWFPIKLRFSPLEYMEYSVPLRIYPEFSDKMLEVLLTGNASLATNIRFRPDANMSQSNPFAAENDNVQVTPSQIAFSHFVPTGQKATSLVFLANQHKKHAMSFTWPEVPIEGGGSIRFQPATGKIAANGSVPCLVIVTAGNTPITFSTMIRCVFENENKKLKYNFEYTQWKMKTEFIDTHKPRGTKRNPTGVPQPPVPPESFSCLLTVSVYIGSVFGLYDVIAPKEKSRMPISDPVSMNRSIPSNIDQPSGLILSNFEREISKEIISNILLDIISCPGFENNVRVLTKRQPPFYEEYKESEERQPPQEEVEEQFPELHQQTMEEILEVTLFNLIQELNTRFLDSETQQTWYDLPPVQPTALINIEENKDCLI